MEELEEEIKQEHINASYRVIVRNEGDMTSVSFGVYNAHFDKDLLRKTIKEFLEATYGI